MSDHETVFETEAARWSRGAAVGPSFMPLSDNSFLTGQVLLGEGPMGGRPRPAQIRRAGASDKLPKLAPNSSRRVETVAVEPVVVGKKVAGRDMMGLDRSALPPSRTSSQLPPS